MFSPAADHEPISAPRTARTRRRGRVPLLLACAAAVPAVLLTGCSSGAAKPAAAPASAAPKPSAAPAVRYATLPSPCSVLSAKTVSSLVPGVKNPKGSVAAAGEPKDRMGCSWNGLHGYQYRYLDTAFQRYDNTAGGPAGDDQATSAYATQVRRTAADATAGAGTPHTTEIPGVGDEASVITWTDGKTHDLNATVVTRSANAVLTVDLIGAGLEGDHAPKTSDLSSGAEKAAKEALASLG